MKKRLTIALGIAAGAALTAFALSRSSKKEWRVLREKVAELGDELFNTTKDLTRIKRISKKFI
ncbi:MAG TPA: hypothetical protein ENJ39_06755 [Flammeovirgaceae bacterium]|nr:hypothetical protein [Flammeovirgaceae bacterium]